jgi:hypothetical protein
MLRSSLCGDVREPDRADGIIPIRGGEGGQKENRLPGEHGISRPTIAQGRPGVRPHLYAAVRSFSRVHFARQTAGAGRRPAFPAPSFLEGDTKRAKLGRDKPRGCEGVSAIRVSVGGQRSFNLRRHCGDVERGVHELRSRAPDAAQRFCGALQSRGPCLPAIRIASGSRLCAAAVHAAARPGHEKKTHTSHRLKNACRSNRCDGGRAQSGRGGGVTEPRTAGQSGRAFDTSTSTC